MLKLYTIAAKILCIQTKSLCMFAEFILATLDSQIYILFLYPTLLIELEWVQLFSWSYDIEYI